MQIVLDSVNRKKIFLKLFLTFAYYLQVLITKEYINRIFKDMPNESLRIYRTTVVDTCNCSIQSVLYILLKLSLIHI